MYNDITSDKYGIYNTPDPTSDASYLISSNDPLVLVDVGTGPKLVWFIGPDSNNQVSYYSLGTTT